MSAFLFGNDFWLSPTPVLLVGLLATVVVLAWSWRVQLPALLLVQLGIGPLAVHRTPFPGEWSSIFAWVVAACVLILLLSIQHSNGPPLSGRVGTTVFRALLLALAAFLFSSLELGDLLPLADRGMTRLIVWVAFCALFATANVDGALDSGLALLLWLISAEVTLVAITPVALIVVLVGTLFLLVALACGYLLVAENLELAAENRPASDMIFPHQRTPRMAPLLQELAAWRGRLTSLGRLAQRGKQS